MGWNQKKNQNQIPGCNQYQLCGVRQQYQNPSLGINQSASRGKMTNERLLQKPMVEIGTKNNVRIDKQDENIRNIQVSQMSLEKQNAQVANSLNLHPQGSFSDDTEPNINQLYMWVIEVGYNYKN